MRRREFIAGLGGAASAFLTARPRWVRAQQGGPMKRVGVLSVFAENDTQQHLRIATFQSGLAKLGWADGRNVRIDTRWGGGDIDHLRAVAAELVGLRPDVLLANGTPALAALQQATRAIPIVFATVNDPVDGGFVASLARPGGNITGFIATEASLAGKWVDLLNGIAPGLGRAALLFNPDLASTAGEFFRHAEAAAARLNVEMIAAAVRDERDVEEALAALARLQNGGLLVNADAFTLHHRQQIIDLATQHRLPAIYSSRSYAMDGGLMSYGIDPIDPYRQAASYVDRILRGEKPADLPVQAPTRFELVINLRTARAMGLDVSRDMLSIADEVIE